MVLDIRKEFYFARHGETDYNVQKIFAGSGVDVPLNEKGKKQASILGTILAELSIDRFYHSPLVRARDTMHIATKGKGEVLEELKECYDRTWLKVLALESGGTMNETECFLQQVIDGLNKALAAPGIPLLVSHGGVHRAICYHLQIENHDWSLHNCGLVHFKPVGDYGWQARLLH